MQTNLTAERKQEIQDAVASTLNGRYPYVIHTSWFKSPEEASYAMHVGSNFNPSLLNGSVHFNPKKSPLCA